jgi:transglutaminase-like putative cysteine protease
MAVLFEIVHTTTYSYSNPVTFGRHRAMFLPRPGARGRLVGWSATTSIPSKIRWTIDALGNNVTDLEFGEPAKELVFSFKSRGLHFGTEAVETFDLEPRATTVPVQYTPDEWEDLAGFIRPHAPDPDGTVAAWAKSFVCDYRDRTSDILGWMLNAFRDNFTYNAREAEGTQLPAETLRTKSGTCRDYAWLMVEALRRLGIAARFVSGYLYDAALDGHAVGTVGAGATHAWLAVYLPGAGWTHYDPTNRLSAGYDLIPVAIARHPGQAVPLEGSWFGNVQDYLGMSVEVTVHKLGETTDSAA